TYEAATAHCQTGRPAREAQGMGIAGSVQLDRLLPVLVELCQACLGFLEGARRLLDALAVTVEVRRGEQLLQLAQGRLLLGDVGFEVLDLPVRETPLALPPGRDGGRG